LANSFRFGAGSKWSITIYAVEGLDKELSTLRAVASLGSSVTLPTAHREWPSGVGVVGHTFEQNREIVVPDVTGPEVRQLFQDIEFAYKSIVAMPIQTGGRAWGVVTVTSDVAHHFNPNSEGFQNIEPIRGLASTIALAVAINEATERLTSSNTDEKMAG
jgi:putative methionine-R-sulfoxide reductase with GAF domain